MRNSTKDDDTEIAVTVVAEILVVESMKRENKQTSKTGVDKDMVIIEVIILIV